MINGRLWTVVSPNVGVPLFFIGVVTASLYIHFQVITKTDWFVNFIQGAEAAAAASGG